MCICVPCVVDVILLRVFTIWSLLKIWLQTLCVRCLCLQSLSFLIFNNNKTTTNNNHNKHRQSVNQSANQYQRNTLETLFTIVVRELACTYVCLYGTMKVFSGDSLCGVTQLMHICTHMYACVWYMIRANQLLFVADRCNVAVFIRNFSKLKF